MPDRRKKRLNANAAAGFSMLELMIVVTVLVIIFGVVVKALEQMQHRDMSESARVDTVQETRDFIDQVVRDIHDTGFPPGRINSFGNPTCDNGPPYTDACGIRSYSPTQIVYEGDLEGTGTIYDVTVQVIANPVTGNCPCILQRGVVTKQQYVSNQAPTYFTEVNGVLNSGNGAGAATFAINLAGPGTYTNYGPPDVFDAWDQTPSLVGACVAPNCTSIRTIQITANVVPSQPDPVTQIYPVFSITSKARLNF